MSRASAAASLCLLVGVVAGCSGTASATPTPATPTPASTSAPSTIVLAPTGVSAISSPAIGSAAMSSPATGPGASGPGRTLLPGEAAWPPEIIDAGIAVGAMDQGVQQAGTDLQNAAQAQDLQALLGAADGLADLVRQAQPSADRLAGFDKTAAFGTALVPVLAQLRSAATDVGTALRAGDAAAAQTATTALSTALRAYGALRVQLVDVADTALQMRRGLLQ